MQNKLIISMSMNVKCFKLNLIDILVKYLHDHLQNTDYQSNPVLF